MRKVPHFRPLSLRIHAAPSPPPPTPTQTPPSFPARAFFFFFYHPPNNNILLLRRGFRLVCVRVEEEGENGVVVWGWGKPPCVVGPARQSTPISPIQHTHTRLAPTAASASLSLCSLFHSISLWHRAMAHRFPCSTTWQQRPRLMRRREREGRTATADAV